MNNRIQDSLSVLQEQECHNLFNFVRNNLVGANTNHIESKLSIGGVRGPYWMPGNSENADKTLRRRLRRAIMLSLFFAYNQPLSTSKRIWNKNKTALELITELRRLEGLAPVPQQAQAATVPPPVAPRPNYTPHNTPPPIPARQNMAQNLPPVPLPKPVQSPKKTAEELVREATGGRLMGNVCGKWYYWLKQATHTDEAITDASVAEMRGWVPETIAGIPTGRYVAEDGGDSCGPTSIAIAYYYITNMEMAEDRMRQMAAEHPEGYHAGGVGTGTYTSALKYVLDNIAGGVPTGWIEKHGVISEKNVRRYVRKNRPVIFNVGWHFTVGVEIVGNSLVCIDPWFGPTEVPLDNLPDYPHPGKAFNGWVVSLPATM